MNDAFSVLGLEPHFLIDRALLDERHRNLSKALHPDRHSMSSSTDRRRALNQAIAVNEAFRELKDPFSRAKLILSRSGIEVSEQTLVASPDFLMSVMELRESLSHARRAADLKTVETLTRQVSQEQSKVTSALAAALGEGELPAALEQASALAWLSKLRYFQRFLNEARAIEDELL